MRILNLHPTLIFFHIIFIALRPSILERCILKVSTSSVAVGTDDLDSKRSGARPSTLVEMTERLCFLTCLTAAGLLSVAATTASQTRPTRRPTLLF